MNRFIYLPYFEDFFKSLKLALKNFGVNHNIKESQYFANKLGIDGLNASNMFTALLNAGTGKDLKVRELLHILDNLDHESRKIILDFLASRYDFVLSENLQNSNINFKDLKDLLLKMHINQSDITEEYLNIFSDGVITSVEVKELQSCIYALQAYLREFESRVIQQSKDL